MIDGTRIAARATGKVNGTCAMASCQTRLNLSITKKPTASQAVVIANAICETGFPKKAPGDAAYAKTVIPTGQKLAPVMISFFESMFSTFNLFEF